MSGLRGVERALALVLAGSAVASAAPVHNNAGPGATGNWYERVDSSIDALTADTTAQGMTHNGSTGYLANLTSLAENNWVLNRVGASSHFIGLNDAVTEGTFAWQQGEQTLFTNWSPGEPNNVNDEDYVELRNTGQWNDIRGDVNRAGYIVEYEGRIAPTFTGPGIGLNGWFYDVDNDPTAVNTFESIINNQHADHTFRATTLNYPQSGNTGDNTTLPNYLGVDGADAPNVPMNQSVVRLTGTVNITEADDIDASTAGIQVNFRLGSDDGSVLRIGGKTVVARPGLTSFSHTTGVATVHQAGLHAIEVIHTENGGQTGVHVESSLGQASGNYATLTSEQLMPDYGFKVQRRNAPAGVDHNSLDEARKLFDGTTTPAAKFEGYYDRINFIDTGGNGNFADDTAFLGGDSNNEDQFAMRVQGKVYIPTAGKWTFGVNSDDGFEMSIDGVDILSATNAAFSGDLFSHEQPRGAEDSLAVYDFLEAGFYDLSLLYFERGGGAELELFAAMGEFATFGSDFRLVGDAENGGLYVFAAIPEPASLSLLALPALACLRRRR